jgi:hypothetical protein
MNIHRIAATGTLFVAAAAMAAGLLLAYLAWQRSSLPLAQACLLLLFAAPAFAVAAVLARNRQLEPALAAPPHAFVDALSRAEFALRLIKVARAHVCVLAVHALVMWICQAGGLIDAPHWVAGYLVIVAVSLAGYLPWLGRRERDAGVRCGDLRRRLRETRPAAL